MKINELLSTYDFHDSMVETLSLDNDDLKVKIDFCNWRQLSFKEGEKEIISAELVFYQVKNVVLDATISSVDLDGILSVSYTGDNPYAVKIVLEGENNIKILTFSGEDGDLLFKE